jgi:hypothetical protein
MATDEGNDGMGKLTREQIEAATNDQLNVWVAERALGWRDLRFIRGQGVEYWVGESPKGSRTVPFFSHDWVAMSKLMKAKRAAWQATYANGEPQRWFIISTAEGWRAEIVWGHHDGAIVYSAEAPTLPLAVCRAALYEALGLHDAIEREEV